MGTPKKPKILFYDLETTPLLGYAWSYYDTNLIKVVEPSRILSFSYKWKGEKKVHFVAAKKSDRTACRKLWNLFNEANVLVAHNGDAFDLKTAYARFAIWGLGEPSAYSTVDTLKVARRHFRFYSNRLNELAGYLGLGRKEKHTGKDMWFDALAGEESAWRMMERYNEQDVRLLERVYGALEPYMKTHPNLALMAGGSRGDCPRCGSQEVRKDGVRYTAASAIQAWECKVCGKKFQNGRAA